MSEQNHQDNTPPGQDQYFVPLPESDDQVIPESISGGHEELPFTDPTIALKPLRFLRRATIGFFSLLLVLAVWQSIELMLALTDMHWLLGLTFSLVLLLLTGLAGRAVLELLRYKRDFRDIESLQQNAETMRQTRSTNQLKGWIEKGKRLYKGKPQQQMLDQALTQLPDYANDAEAIEHIDNLFMQKLDQQALASVTRHSRQAALMVALSPVAMIDMLLVAWRSLRMIDEICQIYGIRPSLPVRTRLLQMVLEQIALAGATELISGQLAEFASNKLVGMVSTQAASGLGIGLYSARIGVQVMGLCRPVPFAEGKKSGIRAVANKLRATLLKQFSGH